MESEPLKDIQSKVAISPKRSNYKTSSQFEGANGLSAPDSHRNPTFLDVMPQIIAACISLSSVPQAGVNMAFSGVLIPQLKDEGMVGFSKEAASWIASIVAISQPIGALFVGPLMDAIGRKSVCIITNIPIVIGWLFIYFTKSELWPIYVGRMLCGFGSGMTTVGIVYTAEVAHSRYRPMLLSLNSVNVALGILLATVLGAYLSWRTCALVFGAMGIISTTMSLFIPESPLWLVNFTESSRELIAKHVRSLNRSEWLFAEEWDRLQESKATRRTAVQEEQEKAKSIFQRLKGKIACFFEPASFRPLTTLFIVFFLQQTSGTYVVIFYTVNIFRAVGGDDFGGGFDGYTATMALGILRFVMSFVSAVLSNVMGRRPIMLVSCVGMGLSSLATALFLSLNHVDTVIFASGGSVNATASAAAPGADQLVSSWWVLISLLIFVCIGSVGQMVIPWTLIGELLPTKIRASGSGLMVSYSSLLLFSVVKTFPGLLDLTTLPVLFLSYATMSFVSALYVYFCLPETFRKNFQEIAQMFKTKNVAIND
ncbi:Sugar (and other) transporter [Nesidiocoris tenuis]|uniref:Sugar (And other) transporter n=1 Tax=Nesidiocoris tenuis TaxID=355587 RepID=A0ABN7AU43_9HEMI|nr:Sugar (and other) transporter [Nesidiocoris tenuis]